ncbi:MAG: 5'-3' exonuclease H3TH domain-containing protein [bacterium]|nr:5'-3' exonuclease H3TH domain-containing protein [bacterium]
MEPAKKLIIIDSNSVIHRAFHALPPLTTKSGEVVNAVYGFLLVFLKAIKEFRPDYIAACFDFPAPTFRHEKYKEYKAKRIKAPPELYSQIPKTKEVLGAFGVQVFEKEGFEADDLIGTIADLASKAGAETIILSGDTDNFQLINPRVKVYNLRKGVKDTVLYDENLVKEKYLGLEPRQLLDLRALRGDQSDNIPGVPGVGEKTATSLILEFGTLEAIYDNLALITSKVREKLAHNKEQAFLSKELAEIKKDVPIDFILERCGFGGYDRSTVQKALEKLEFYSLIPRL